MPASRVQLKSIDLEGFKGVNKKIHVEFGLSATVLSAWNGRGKSTLLGAIEWGLFGELRFQPAENATHDELVSVFHPGGRAVVNLTLAQDGKEVRIRREKVVRKRATTLVVRDAGGKDLEGDEASSYIFRLTGLSFEDFYRAAFLHQDSIRGLLMEEQKDRDEALDRLLGVEEIRNILTSIRIRPVTEALNEIERSEQMLMQRLAGAGETAEATRARAREEALETGWTEEELTPDQGLASARALAADLADVSSKFGDEVQDEAPADSIEALERAARRVKATTRNIRISVGKQSPVDETLGKVRALRELRGEIEAAGTSWGDSGQNLAEHGKEHGKPEEWDEESTQLKETQKKLTIALNVLDVHGRVVADAIAFLEAVPSSTECPVCGDPKLAADLAGRLRSKVKKVQAMEVGRLNAELETAKARLEAIGEFRKQRTRLETGVKEAREALDRVRGAGWELLGAKRSVTDPLPEVAIREAALTRKLDGLQNLHADREKRLEGLDDAADKLRTLYRFLKADQGFERVQQKVNASDDGGSKGMEEEKQQLLDLRTDLEAIVRALNGLATGRAQTALDRCGGEISRMYGVLCNHPYYDGLQIELGQKAIQGVERNTYRIVAYSTKDGQRTSASSRLSTAQMNCVALSAYLSLSKVLQHNLGFILLDDPSQNLDGEHKKALASVLHTLLPATQIVIGTHDSEFDGFLRSALGRDGVRWYDLGWAPREGTSLKASDA